mgnify:CR=1 FL=1
MTDLLELSAEEFLEHIEVLAETGGEFFEESVVAGEAALKNMDTGKWFIGDLLTSVKKRYGHKQVKEYANRLRRGASTLYEWRQMAVFYPRSARAEFLEEPTLSYDHMRKAMRNLGTLDAARPFLQMCAENNWTTGQADVELTVLKGKPRPALKVWDGKGTVTRAEGKKATLDFEDYPNLKHTTYRVVIYELKPHEVNS